MQKYTKPHEQWIKAVYDAYYSNLVLRKTLIVSGKHFKESHIFAFHDITDATGKNIRQISVVCFLNKKSCYTMHHMCTVKITGISKTDHSHFFALMRGLVR